MPLIGGSVALKLILLNLTFVTSYSLAQTDHRAVYETQNLLRDPDRRGQIIRYDSKAREADDFASKAFGGNSQQKHELYNISSDIFAVMSNASGGDAQKMKEQLLKATQNPEQFLKSLPPEIQAKIKSVADKTGQNKNNVNP